MSSFLFSNTFYHTPASTYFGSMTPLPPRYGRNTSEDDYASIFLLIVFQDRLPRRRTFVLLLIF